MTRPPLLVLLFAPLAYLSFCAFAAGLLAYPLHFILPESLVGFKTLVSRGAELLLALGLVPLGRWLGVGRAEMGMALAGVEFRRRLARGFGYGVLMLGLHTVALVAVSVRVVDPGLLEPVRVARLAAKGLLVGLAVASIEEPVFRGFLLGSLARRAGRFHAAWISALYFACLHFLDSDLRPAAGEVRWYSGLAVVLDAFAKFGNIEFNSFLALFTAGAFLACLRLRGFGASLPLCVGVHAGWVFVIKTAKSFTWPNPYISWSWLASHFDGFIGHLSSAWISLLVLWLAWSIYKTRPVPDGGL